MYLINGKLEKTTEELDKILTKEYLQENYINKKLAVTKIAKIIGCDSEAIKRRLGKYNIPIRSYSEAQKGIKRIPRSEEIKKKISESNKGKPQPFSFREKLSKALKGKKQSPEWILKRSLAMRGKNKNISRKHLKNILKAIQASPNKFESQCLQYLNKKYPSEEFKYCGEGSFLIENRSPDFINKKLNIVVLAQGDYYHCNPKIYPLNYYNRWLKKTAQEIQEKDKQTIELFKNRGYTVIVLWEKDIKNFFQNEAQTNQN